MAGPVKLVLTIEGVSGKVPFGPFTSTSPSATFTETPLGR